ncbi:MAG: 16S rRNA (cytosine(1402)-N(4))-methyltransferase RsmH [Planctomycetota bacterium]
MNGADSRDDPAANEHGPVRVHEPVLLQECLSVVDLQPGMTVVDGTVGAGGHASAFARVLGPSGLVVGLDRDAEILPHADRALARARDEGGARFLLRHASYAEIAAILQEAGINSCDRLFLDLGVSSLQLDSAHRGFSFMREGPLDMRMDASRDRPCATDWLRSVSAAELERVLVEYGEERFARRIATAIVSARARHPIATTQDLVDIVVRAVPAPARHGRVHVATRTFQAIRIAVNDELGELQRGLEAGLAALRVGGRLAVLTFHSLEDRIVKHFLREHCELPFRKPMVASAEECRRNPRARSAKLRCGIRRSA